ncbi:MAG: VWA domain-containing protein, partial [Blastocatellia bacterium]
KKKKEKNAPPSPQGVVIINGVSVGPNSLPDLPELEDLPKYFWQDYPKFAPIKIPKAKIAVVSAEEIQRPVLTNKPDEAPVETTRPTLRNQPGEARTTAKTAVEKTTSETEETIKVDTALISVPVRVLDKDSKYVPDLTKKDFKVFEGGTEQEIENFSAVEEPFHVVLLLDMSGSTHFKAEEIQDAALAFIEQLRPQDRVLVASFESAVYVDADFTNDRARLTKAILRTRSGGSTRLYDAVDLALTERLNRIQGRKAIVLFSDGVDTASKGATMVGNLSKIEESNALVYSIRYDTLPDMAPLIQNNRISPVPPQTGVSVRGMNVKEMYERAKMYMNELATRSGGRSYEATTLTDAKTAFANIAEELRRQYWLSYYSSNPKSDGSYRNIRVTVQQAEVKRWAVRAKNGYRAPKK